jgi:protein SCO1/2
MDGAPPKIAAQRRHRLSTAAAFHSALPWAWSLGCLLLGDAACRAWRLPTTSSDLVRGAAGITVLVFLAVRRHWAYDRRAFEQVWLALLLTAAWVGGRLHASIVEAIVIVLSASVPPYCLWRFAPDAGQQGWSWAVLDRATRSLIAAGVALGLPFLSGCAKHESTPHPRSFDLRGEIVEVIPKRRTLLVHHDDIPGYMPSMTMEFGVEDAALSSFKAGQRIEARLVEFPPGEVHLEGIRVTDRLKDSIVEAATHHLNEDTHIRGAEAFREIGEEVPSFALYDQEGDVVSIDRFRGKRIVVNFIYTRCPIATMCPAATARMAELQHLAQARHVPELELISVTLDPAHDTPAVLKAYAEAHGIDSSNFHLLTGPDQAIRNLLVQFGVIAEPTESYLKHTLATVLIDRNGKIVYRADGSSWEVEDFLKKL